MRITKRLPVILALVLTVFLITSCAVSLDGAQEASAGGALIAFLVALGTLVPTVGGAPLISVIVDVVKKIGMPSKYAPLLSVAINFTLFAVRYFAGPERLTQFNTALDAITSLAPFVIALFVSLWATAKSHYLLTPIGLGYSRTPRKV